MALTRNGAMARDPRIWKFICADARMNIYMKHIYERYIWGLASSSSWQGELLFTHKLTSFYYIYPHFFIFKLTAAPGLTAARASYIDKTLTIAAAFKQHQQGEKK